MQLLTYLTHPTVVIKQPPYDSDNVAYVENAVPQNQFDGIYSENFVRYIGPNLIWNILERFIYSIRKLGNGK